MNTKLLAIAVGVILILGAGGLFLYSQGSKPQTTENNTTTATDNENTGMSLMDLVTSGQSQRCTFATTNEQGTSNGTVYVSGSNVRSDITTNLNDKESEISMIRNGDDNYIWGTDMEEGIKMTISLEELSANTQVKQYSSFNPDEKVDFDCAPWTVDATLFTPPSDIKFTDMSALMDSMKAETTGMPGYSCAGIADAAARAACENAMGQ